jgi:hypothetical protein
MSTKTTVTTSSRKKRIGKALSLQKGKRAATLNAVRVYRQKALRLPSQFRGQTVMPERYSTKLVTSLQFYVPASGMDQVNGNYMDVKVNSIYQPFGATYTATGVGTVWSMNGQYTTGSSSTLNPIGYTVMSNLYDRYKVLGYSLRFSVMTGVATDILEAMCFPLGQEEIPNPTAGVINSYVFKGQPKCDFKLIHNGGTQMIVRNYGSVADLLGMRKQQWLDIPYNDTAGAGANPAYPGYVGFYMMPLTGATNAQPVIVDVTLTQTVEFTDIKNSALTS